MIKLGLGTVQLGLPYGNNANTTLMPEKEAHSILGMAVEHGISFFDTAIGYGQSELRIGRFCHKMKCTLDVSTKIPAVAKDIWDDRNQYKSFLHASIKDSFGRLGLEKMRLLQFHQCDEDFLQSPAVQANLSDLLDLGLCDAIGISVYTPAQAELACNIDAVGTLQIPVNLIDQRFLSAHLMNVYSKKGVDLIARSVLLQGVLHSSADLPPVQKRPLLESLRKALLNIAGSEPLERLALRYIFGNQKDVLSIGLIGVDSTSSLKQNLTTLSGCIDPVPSELLEGIGAIREQAGRFDLLNPASWNSK